ncbi:MAG: helix-turn-helix transcriptional regulator [Deltaproteobacteria bacterium]|nr:helix-turn-helix transcriptional regulator [Deltaproteobacteria bacterium]
MKSRRLFYKPADSFFARLLKDPETKLYYEEEHVKTSIAMAVKAVRFRAKLTQAQLAKKIGTTQSVIARLEGGGDRRIPSLSLLARIATACHGELEFGFKFKKAA